MKTDKEEPKKKRKKVFKDFAEYWHYVKVLSNEQRDIIISNLSKTEQKSLRTSYDQGGWEDLFMRNACDFTIDQIKQNFGIDLIQLRAKVLSNKPQLVQKPFWQYVEKCFDIPYKHIAYIFDGIMAVNHDSDCVMLTRVENVKKQPK